MSEDFVKHDNGKLRYDLLPPLATDEEARVLTHGAVKYAPGNWRKVPDTARYVAAGLRHVFAYMRGETHDPESGAHHLAHAVCCLKFIIELELEKKI